MSVTKQNKTKDRALIKMVAQCYTRAQVKTNTVSVALYRGQDLSLPVEVAFMFRVAAVGCCKVAERGLSEVRRGVESQPRTGMRVAHDTLGELREW